MAYKRKRASGGRRRTRRRTTRRLRLTRGVTRSNLVSITRRVVFPEFTLPNNTWYTTSYAFSLAQLPSYTDFTNLFEQYRINAVKLQFMPTFDSADLNFNPAGTGSVWTRIPRMYTIIDRDGNPQLSTENAMIQYGNVRQITSPLKPFSVYIKAPCVQVATANNVTLVGGAPKGKQWIDCDNYNIGHWGCALGGIAGGTTSGQIIYQVVATFYMQFKNAI